MAESVRDETISNCLGHGENILNFECAVCLQTCMHPAELPCGHIFCYLCIKGIVNQGRRCAMCRQNIPQDYLEKPRLLKPMDAEFTSQGFDGHLWFYEGHNGWWQYDERTSLELESVYQKKERSCDLLIAGFLYVADFDGMVQYRKNDPSRKRRIKRDLATTAKKGIAGLKTTNNCDLTASNSLEPVLNETIQNLPVSNTPAVNNISSIRIFNSSSNNSGHHLESLNPQRVRESSSRFSLACRPADVTSFNVNSAADSSTSFPGNINLDSVIHNTLDWTVERIHSLSLEVLNDYESLFRNINSYGQLQDNLNQSRYRRAPHNYMSRYLNVSNPRSEPLANNSDSSNRLSHSSYLINNSSNSSFEFPPNSSEETSSLLSEVNQIDSNRSLQSHVLNTPLPPPRNRGTIRPRFRRDSSQDPLTQSHETLFQNSVFNK